MTRLRLETRFAEGKERLEEQGIRISGDQEEGYQHIRVSGVKDIKSFLNHSFEIKSFKLYLESEFSRPFESVEKSLYSSPHRWERLGEGVLTRTKTKVSSLIFRYYRHLSKRKVMT